jgi:hypothetical protein
VNVYCGRWILACYVLEVIQELVTSRVLTRVVDTGLMLLNVIELFSWVTVLLTEMIPISENSFEIILGLFPGYPQCQDPNLQKSVSDKEIA